MLLVGNPLEANDMRGDLIHGIGAPRTQSPKPRILTGLSWARERPSQGNGDEEKGGQRLHSFDLCRNCPDSVVGAGTKVLFIKARRDMPVRDGKRPPLQSTVLAWHSAWMTRTCESRAVPDSEQARRSTGSVRRIKFCQFRFPVFIRFGKAGWHPTEPVDPDRYWQRSLLGT